MRLIHLSDLHIGKRVNGFSMLDDQKYILKKIVDIIVEGKPSAVLISGDIYDKPVPSSEAVSLFDDFLSHLAKLELKIFAISGNHDSPERIAFGEKLMISSGVYMSPVYSGEISPIKLNDNTNIYMLPFIKPSHVRRFFPDDTITSYAEAVDLTLKSLNVDTSNTNILLSHQFVAGSTISDSEDISVGGTDNIPVSVFADFDYVALGHLHSPQSVGRETLRYCGTPLKYSFSEVNHKKSVTIVDIKDKNDINITTKELIPVRDMRVVKGKYSEIVKKSYYESFNLEDYYKITLTDEENIPDAVNKLRVIYKNIMILEYDNKRTQSNNAISIIQNVEEKSPMSYLSEFYEYQNNKEMTEEQYQFVDSLISKIWEGNDETN